MEYAQVQRTIRRTSFDYHGESIIRSTNRNYVPMYHISPTVYESIKRIIYIYPRSL